MHALLPSTTDSVRYNRRVVQSLEYTYTLPLRPPPLQETALQSDAVEKSPIFIEWGRSAKPVKNRSVEVCI